MKIVEEFIVYKKDIIGGKFVKVVLTDDLRYFRVLGSGDGMFEQYEEITRGIFEEWKENYNNY